ncbi:MAG: hypothetical protein M1820_003714 [Bogoriella megaspora]|nr:MAG: hypothetical protein M1820_003714 [Bogoriella megaspora]
MIQSGASVVSGSRTLSPLPQDLRVGLTVVTVFGFLSFVPSVVLICLLTYRIVRRGIKYNRFPNQFLFLIFNLILADIKQSIAFLLNAEWLAQNSITVGGNTCFAQGWFISTGDLASGVWCLAIGFHTLADIVWNLRLDNRVFMALVAGLWTFIYACAVIGIAIHPSDYYVRAGAWCWVNAKYTDERLWLHYLWIFIAEFGVVIIYSAMFAILHYRIRTHQIAPAQASHARRASKYMVIYPIVYVVCTLPIASMRMATMRHSFVPFSALTAGGALITSNGWLDVLLYTITRRVLILSKPDAESSLDEKRGLDTFAFGGPGSEWGTTTTITALKAKNALHTGKLVKNESRRKAPSRQGSREELWSKGQDKSGTPGVKAETVVHVRSEPMELHNFAGTGYIRSDERSMSFDIEKDEK